MLPNIAVRTNQTLKGLVGNSISRATCARHLATTNQHLMTQSVDDHNNNNNTKDKKSTSLVKKPPIPVPKKLKEIKDYDTELRPVRALLYPDQMEWLDERQVRISKPSKNVMQSGTAYMNNWKIEFNSQQRWENWLMGWTSSGDPVSNLNMNFPTKEEAIAFCDRNKLQWFVEEQPERQVRKKSYADNFSWDKRTRLSNK